MSQTNDKDSESASADGGPAFPNSWKETNEYGAEFSFVVPGMTLRDWFAGQALAGLCSNIPLKDVLEHKYTDDQLSTLASDAYLLGYQMIVERNSSF